MMRYNNVCSVLSSALTPPDERNEQAGYPPKAARILVIGFGTNEAAKQFEHQPFVPRWAPCEQAVRQPLGNDQNRDLPTRDNQSLYSGQSGVSPE